MGEKRGGALARLQEGSGDRTFESWGEINLLAQRQKWGKVILQIQGPVQMTVEWGLWRRKEVSVQLWNKSLKMKLVETRLFYSFLS